MQNNNATLANAFDAIAYDLELLSVAIRGTFEEQEPKGAALITVAERLMQDSEKMIELSFQLKDRKEVVAPVDDATVTLLHDYRRTVGTLIAASHGAECMIREHGPGGPMPERIANGLHEAVFAVIDYEQRFPAE